ncbi:hypothetical protein IEN85_07220 [Pelagicoccus sp. NFK12]|uniref:Uncharacterized protein n=1 Tax=Pelagicoccus enzymogenes TaxID=2773457 RepID=A0A927IGY1_9BACT|nr:hypothetical protein [Pelagicoccus enzymogenes]MBD5779279.1 hypothetical protein [Pelagicoccus enzymogenes]
MSSPLSSHSAEPPKKSIFGKPVLIGCIGLVAIFTLLLAGGAYWLFTSGKKVITDEIRKEVIAEIERSGLSGEQQAALKAEIDRLTEEFQQGEISIQELIEIIEGLEQSPAMSVVRYYQIEGDPLDRSSISQEQKDAAMLTIRRFIYGVFEEKIPESAIGELMDPFIIDRGTDENYQDLQFRSNISDEEIFAALAKAKQYADKADIPETDLSPDIAREIREIIDRILEKRKR